MPPNQIEWLGEAKADVRTLDQPTVTRIFEGILRFARVGAGGVNALHGDMAGSFRLRLGDYRFCLLCKRPRFASSVLDIAVRRIAERTAQVLAPSR